MWKKQAGSTDLGMGAWKQAFVTSERKAALKCRP
jgi:hypothetical protein